MAIAPKDVYPAQIDTSDAGFPQGKAQDCAVAGDGSGTPLEKAWINDIWGFQQALLDAAARTPSGFVDKVGASDYLLALRYVATHPITRAVFGFGLTVSSGLQVAGGIQSSDTFIGATGAFFGAFSVGGASSFSGTATFSDGVVIQTQPLILSANSNIISGTSLFTAPQTFNDEIVLASAGRVRKRIVYAADANTTYDVTQCDILILAQLTGVRTYSIDVTGASPGSEIEIRNYDASHAHLVKQVGGTTVAVPVSQPSGLGLTYRPSILRLTWGNGTGLGNRWEPSRQITA